MLMTDIDNHYDVHDEVAALRYDEVTARGR
jgi:hypothetical protein